MGRSESKDAYNTSKQMAQQNQANAQASLGNENKAITDFSKSIDDYGNFINTEFAPGGQFDTSENNLATSVTAGGKNSLQDYFSNVGNRTGTGTTPQMIAATEEGSRQGERDTANFLNQALLARIGALGHGEETVMQERGMIPGMYGGQYATSLGGANAAMGNATSAAQTPGFWDTFLPALAGGAAQVGFGFTPGAPGNAKPCWIAEAIYGVDDLRTHLIREWLSTEFILRPIGRVVMWAYQRFGRQVARMARRSKVLAAALKPIFDCALSHALAWKLGKKR
jgi:hypothetical protein